MRAAEFFEIVRSHDRIAQLLNTDWIPRESCADIQVSSYLPKIVSRDGRWHLRHSLAPKASGKAGDLEIGAIILGVASRHSPDPEARWKLTFGDTRKQVAMHLGDALALHEPSSAFSEIRFALRRGDAGDRQRILTWLTLLADLVQSAKKR